MTEHDHQVEIFRWCDLHKRKYPELQKLFAVPNAGKRTGRQGKWMKAEGLKAGVPDMCLPVARGGFHALFIELKKTKCAKSAAGTIKPNQAAWLDALNEEGNMAVMCVGWEAATRTLADYLEMSH